MFEGLAYVRLFHLRGQRVAPARFPRIFQPLILFVFRLLGFVFAWAW